MSEGPTSVKLRKKNLKDGGTFGTLYGVGILFTGLLDKTDKNE